jgi:hypothetical protein
VPTDFNNLGNVPDQSFSPTGVPPEFSTTGLPSGGSGSGRGCAIGAIFFAVMIAFALFYSFFLYDYFNPLAIKGSIIDAVYVPVTENGGHLVFETDDSFYYTQKTTTNSSFSMSTESLWNKTYLYVYDPLTKTVLKKIKTEYTTTPPQPKMFYLNQKIWMIAYGDDDNAAVVQTVDPTSGTVTMDTQAFLAKYPSLKSGIADMTLLDSPRRLNIQAKDGLKYVFTLENETLVSEKEYNDAEQKDKKTSQGSTSVFVLTDDDRGLLYVVTGPLSKLKGEIISDSELENADTMKFFYDATATKLTPDTAYLKGVIIYQDPKLAVILHQVQLGNDSDRLLTCLDTQGKVLWTLGQADLFSQLALTANDSFSDIFFIKSDLSGTREGNIFLFKMKDVGIMGIDVTTGKKLWVFNS